MSSVELPPVPTPICAFSAQFRLRLSPPIERTTSAITLTSALQHPARASVISGGSTEQTSQTRQTAMCMFQVSTHPVSEVTVLFSAARLRQTRSHRRTLLCPFHSPHG